MALPEPAHEPSSPSPCDPTPDPADRGAGHVTHRSDSDPPGWQRIHPHLQELPTGRLVLTVSRDRDIPDEEMLVFLSDDQGRSWRQATNWPTADQRGEHVGTHLIALPDGQAIVLNTMGLFPTGQAGRYILPSWRSGDGGHTWTKPVGMPVWGILPKLVTLADGTVLLASGRPDVTLSLSVDGGRRWPMTYRFLEDGKPLDASTRNNTMIAIGPQTVLYMYDHGGYHALPPEFEGPARVVAHTIDVTRG